MAGHNRATRSAHPLLGWLIGVTIAVAALHLLVYVVWGHGLPLRGLVWYVPTMHSFVALAAVSIAFLAFGRYQVLHEPGVFWLGFGFVVYTIFSIFYVVAWPEIALDIGNLATTPRLLNVVSWFWHLAFSSLVVFLLVALYARWPNESTSPRLAWPGLVLVGAIISLVIGLLPFVLAEQLPSLAAGAVFTPLNLAWNYAMTAAFLVAAFLSVRRYLVTGDTIFGFVAIAEVLFAAAVHTTILGGQYQDFWWYWQRILWVIAFSIMLFGLLAEYVSLYRRQLEKASELEKAQADVVAERNRLRVVIDAAPFGIILHTAEEGRIVLANQSTEAVMGRPTQLGSRPADCVDYYRLRRPNGEPVAVEDLPSIRALRGEVCSSIELLVEHPSGRQVYVLANAAPLRDARGAIAGAIVGLQDITPLREQTLLREEFLSAAAHELRTPVTTIKGYVQILRRWLASADAATDREARAVTVINAQCDRLNRRVQELLDVVRIQREGIDVHRVRFDLGDVVAEVVAETEALVPTAAIRVERTAETPVEASQESVAEVLGTLIDNAVRHSPPGAEVDVRVVRVDGEARVEVRDHGPGIARERQPHIFEPFYETAPAGKPGYRGVVGLGLYLGRLAIERNHGRIWLDSEPGEGSSFFVSLPLAEPPDDEASPKGA